MIFRTILFCAWLSGCALTPGYSQPGKANDAGHAGDPAQAEKLIRRQHQEQLCLLSHEFIYTVTADMYDTVISFTLVKDGESHFTAWIPDSNINTIYATAFRVDTAGHFVTSRYAVEPWNNVYDQSVLKSVFSKELGLPEGDIHVSGLSRKIRLRNGNKSGEGIVLPTADTLLRNTGWLLCQRPSSAGMPDISGHVIPAGGEEVAAAGGQEASVTIVPHAPAYVYGYQPHGLADSLTLPTVRRVVGTEKSLPEGAPVFNEQGVFLGVYTGVNRKTTQDGLAFFPVVLHL